MDKHTFNQATDTISEYYKELKSFMNARKNLILAMPQLTEEEIALLRKANKYQPLDEIIAGEEFKELTKWKKKNEGLKVLYKNTDKIILTNNELIKFIRIYRDKIDEILIEQISKGQNNEDALNGYTEYNRMIRELQTVNRLFEKVNNDIYISRPKNVRAYLDKQKEENIKSIEEIKEKSELYVYKNKSLDEYIKVKDEYKNLISNARKEINILETDMHTDEISE